MPRAHERDETPTLQLVQGPAMSFELSLCCRPARASLERATRRKRQPTRRPRRWSWSTACSGNIPDPMTGAKDSPIPTPSWRDPAGRQNGRAAHRRRCSLGSGASAAGTYIPVVPQAQCFARRSSRTLRKTIAWLPPQVNPNGQVKAVACERREARASASNRAYFHSRHAAIEHTTAYSQNEVDENAAPAIALRTWVAVAHAATAQPIAS